MRADTIASIARDADESSRAQRADIELRRVTDAGATFALAAPVSDHPVALLAPDDPLFADQWHLWDPISGINVLGVWDDYTGAGVRIGIYDSGVEYTHPDLASSYNAAAHISVDGVLNTGVPTTETETPHHGTGMAGVIVAARNGIGGVGIAYGATLTSVNIFDAYWNPLIPQVLNSLSQFDVTNHSWTRQSIDDDRTNIEPGSYNDVLFAALQDAADIGRGGLGTIIIQAAGNVNNRVPNTDYDTIRHTDDVNLHGMQNSRHVVTVAATNVDGFATTYSVSGTSLLVAAPGGGFAFGSESTPITTTDRVGSEGYSPGDSTTLAGTSLAAPQVTGVVALMLEANPGLGWRDVQEILAATARHTNAPLDARGRDIGGGSVLNDTYGWVVNSAQTWNGGGYHYSGDVGFGLVDALAAVRLAETWRLQQTSANEIAATVHVAGPWTVADLGTTTIEFEITSDLAIESVEIFLDFAGAYPAMDDLDITLTSPDGTTYSVMHDAGLPDLALPDWIFLSRAYFGESSLGVWTLTVHDDETNHSGIIGAASLTIYGSPESADDIYIFTNDFALMVEYDASRATLADADNVGIDTLNFAAVSSALLIDMNPGGLCTIDGQATLIGAAAMFENVFLGDGADIVIGNAANNVISGGRGADLLDGGGGFDTSAYFRSTSTSASWVRNADGSWTVTSADGVDTLTNVEFLDFTDRDVHLDRASRTFSGDGTSDILFRGSTGAVVSWSVNGTSLTSAAFLGSAAPSDWTPLGTGDFSGDGSDDVIWQHVSGLVYGWRMNGGTIEAAVAYVGVNAEWSFMGMGDFNRDGVDDMAWRHVSGVVYTWELSPNSIGSAGYVTGLGLDWTLQGFGDFNSDGRDDFLWRNDDGTTYVWGMDGRTIASAGATSAQVGNDWTILGVGDFNRDGRDDILWQDSTGLIASWQMDGSTVIGTSFYGSLDQAEWAMQNIGDYNGDGRDDILWRNLDDGVVYVWILGAGIVATGGAISGVGFEWDVIGD